MKLTEILNLFYAAYINQFDFINESYFRPISSTEAFIIRYNILQELKFEK